MPKPSKLSSGSYRAQFHVKGVHYDKTFKTLGEAERYIELHTTHGGNTFAAFAELDYYELPVFTELAHNSKLMYCQALGHLMPVFGPTPLHDISKMQLAKYRAVRSSA
jgi:hypothetical protein